MTSAVRTGHAFSALVLPTLTLPVPREHWQPFVLLGIAAAGVAGASMVRSGHATSVALSAAIVVAYAVAVLATGLSATGARRAAIEALSPDRIRTRTLVGSLHGWTGEPGPTSAQAVALKDCTAYSWSYRGMAFNRLSPDVAVKVLPRDWVADCGIARGR